MIRSLRLRLILGTTLAMAALYAVMSLVLYVAIQRSLWNDLDSALLVKARAIAAVVEQAQKGLTFDLEPGQLDPQRPGDGFALWTDDGKVLASSANMAHFPRPAITTPGESTGFSRLPDGHRARHVTLRFLPRLEEDGPRIDPARRTPVTLLVLRDTSSLDTQLRQLVWLLAGSCALAILAAAAIMKWVIHRGLRPLRDLAARIQRLGDNDLRQRIALANAPAEIDPIVERLNELLARLEASFDRERAFTADVAHELRTPLAGLTAALEVCSNQRRSPADYEIVIHRCLKTSRAMRSMVENLLTLARADARQLSVHLQNIDVERLIREVSQTFEQPAAARNLDMQFLLDTPGQIRTDLGLLELVLRNLIDNAVSYTPDGGQIAIRTAADDAAIAVTIENPAGTLTPQDLSNMFDRFWRRDEARNSDGKHCGLGLALCQRIVSLLDGTLAASVDGGTFKITVRIPHRTARETNHKEPLPCA
jgi:heavy metal sensor kinase